MHRHGRLGPRVAHSASRRVHWELQQTWLRFRRAHYLAMSTNRDAFAHTRVGQPTLLLGSGKVEIGQVQLGYWPSPDLFSGYIHIEARGRESRVTIRDGVSMNNSCIVISCGSSIDIGEGCLIGTDVEIYDTDFHAIGPSERTRSTGGSAPVTIGMNVFIGSGTRILKGSMIGDNAVVGAGSIVTGHIPPNVVAAGAPCRVVKSLDESQ